MRRARDLLLGSLPLFAAFPLGLTSEVVPLARNADGFTISRGDAPRDAEEAPSIPPFDLRLGSEVRQDVGLAGPAPLAADCWIAGQWVETIHGDLHLCTKWECSDGRSWVD